MLKTGSETINIPYFKSYATDLITYQLRLRPEEMMKAQTAIAEICLYGETDYIPTGNIEKMYFEKMHDDLKVSINTYKRSVENGKKGGRPKTSKKPIGYSEGKPELNLEHNHLITITKPITITKDRNNTSIVEIINYLNDVCSTKYKSSTKKNKELINVRLKEGFTVDDFQKVIDKKYNNWINTDDEKYLRPETLFGNKFEGYLNQISTKKEFIFVKTKKEKIFLVLFRIQKKLGEKLF